MRISWVPLKSVATVRVSNVDKKTVEGDQPVRLCNYTDVYYNNTILADMSFMSATATQEQVRIFGLCKDDIVITKDSETAEDIGIASHVQSSDRDLVCGYHLAIVRPTRARIHGRFLFWSLMSRHLRDQFSISATGVTRFGLRTESIASSKIPFYSLEKQRTIADFLDVESARIDTLIAKKVRLIALLEQRLSVKVEMLLTGHDKSQAEKTSTDIPSIPEIPSSWQSLRNKTFLREVNNPSSDGQEELLSVSHLSGVTSRSEKEVNMFIAESLEGYKKVSVGDLVINTMWAWMGAAGTSSIEGIVSPAYGVYRFDQSAMLPQFFDGLIRTRVYIDEMTRFSKGVWSSRLRLYPDEFLRLSSPVPPLNEQKEIVNKISVLRQRASRSCAALRKEVELLQERRHALITAAVTGEMDVPGVSA